jgi:molybdate transport system substrate-binding protein
MKRKCIRLFLLILTCTVLLAGVVGCSETKPTYAKEIFVFAAAGTKPAIDEAAKLFEQKYATKVTINYGGGGEVLSSMVLSKTGDIYIAPEQRFMNSAKKQGAIDDNSTITTIGYMIPVIGVKKGNPKNIQSLADLAKPGIQVVMGNPETTALGDLVPQMLQKTGLYDAVKQNIVTNVPQVTAMITMLKMSQVDVGVIWHYFGTTASNDVDIIWIPKEYITGIGEIQAVVSTYSQEAKTAQKFIDLLVSSEGKEIFKKNGYIVEREEANKYWLAAQ